jgi:hypothetical protein
MDILFSIINTRIFPIQIEPVEVVLAEKVHDAGYEYGSFVGVCGHLGVGFAAFIPSSDC